MVRFNFLVKKFKSEKKGTLLSSADADKLLQVVEEQIAAEALAKQVWLPAVATKALLQTPPPEQTQNYLCRVLADTVENNGVWQWIGGAETTAWSYFGDNQDFVDDTELDAAITEHNAQTSAHPSLARVSALDAHASNTTAHTTAAEKQAWSGKQDASVTLTDAAASNALPSAASVTVASLFQTIRNNLKALFSYFTSGVLNIANGGTGNTTGLAASATKLATARKLKTDLSKTAEVTFDGSADQNSIPITGTLPIANGGTGATTQAAAQTALGIPPFIVDMYHSAAGVVTVVMSRQPATIAIHDSYNATIAGTWGAAGATMTFTPTTASLIIAGGYGVKVT